MLHNPILATLIGISAIVMWSTLVGLIRLISDELYPLTCLMLLYTISTIILCLIFKLPKFNQIPKIYYALITFLFVAYELCFSFSIALAQNPIQTIEVGVINHLWPTFTIILMLFTRYLRFNAKLLVGIFLSALGVIMIQTQGFQISMTGVIQNLLSNPISYLLAFTAALLWAFYCVVLMKYKPESNIIVALFFCTSIFLVIKWIFSTPLPLEPINIHNSILILCAAVCLSLGYAAWNIGMIYGYANVLVSSSYFVPILSAYFSSLLFGVRLDQFFWLGTSLVVLGSIICWAITGLPSSWRYKIKNILG